jgi:membrane protease YdiL (CAAX protease family)
MASEYYRVTDWETRLRSLGTAAGLVVGAFLVGAVLTLVSVQLLSLAGLVSQGMDPADMPPVALVVLFGAQFVGFGVVVVAYIRYREERDLFRIGVPSLTDVGWIVGGIVALIAVAAVIGQIVQLLGAETATNQVVELGERNPVVFLYMIPVTIVFVAPAEEALFRGAVQGLFRRAYGVLPGVILASALFGVAHYLALTGGGKVTYIAVAAGLGIVLGALYELTENLAVPIAVHGLWNTILFGSQYLIASGTVSV